MTETAPSHPAVGWDAWRPYLGEPVQMRQGAYEAHAWQFDWVDVPLFFAGIMARPGKEPNVCVATCWPPQSNGDLTDDFSMDDLMSAAPPYPEALSGGRPEVGANQNPDLVEAVASYLFERDQALGPYDDSPAGHAERRQSAADILAFRRFSAIALTEAIARIIDQESWIYFDAQIWPGEAARVTSEYRRANSFAKARDILALPHLNGRS